MQSGRNTITADRQRAFIRALAETGSVALASKVIGNSDKSLYALKLAPGAESFAAAWDRAVQLGARQILDILVDHAINGTPETIYKDGELVAERRRCVGYGLPPNGCGRRAEHKTDRVRCGTEIRREIAKGS